MSIELARTFVVENEWYWRITENAQTFTPSAAVRDFLAPLATLGKGRFELTDMTADDAARTLSFRVGEQTTEVVFSEQGDRFLVNSFVGDVNRALGVAQAGVALALIVPRRYELRGALFTVDELAALLGDPILLVPTTRASWRSIPS